MSVRTKKANPLCGACGKVITKRTSMMWVNHGETPVKFLDESPVHNSLNGKDILKILRRKPSGMRMKDGGRSEILFVWLGDYSTRGGHFCSLMCCERFAHAAFNAGYRLRKASAKTS